MFFLKRKREAVDNGAEDLEELGNAIKSLGLVGELEEHIVDGSADERPKIQEFAINPVQRGLEKVALSRVLRVKELKKLEHKAVVNVRLGDIGVEILALDEAKEELVNDLNVWPRNLQDRLILFRIEGFALGVHRWWNGAEQVLGKHVHNARIHRLGDDLAIIGNVVEKFVKSQPLDLLGLHIAAGIVKVKDYIALVDLLHEQLLPPLGRDLMESRQLLQFAMS